MKKILQSGSTLEITRAPFAVSHSLFKTTMRELGKIDLKLGAKGKDLKELFKVEIGDEAVNTFKNVVTSLLSSDDIEAVLWLCFERALYNNQKITRELFDNDVAASDYLEIAKEVMVYNLTPFTKSLQSLLQSVQLEKISDTQKSQ